MRWMIHCKGRKTVHLCNGRAEDFRYGFFYGKVFESWSFKVFCCLWHFFGELPSGLERPGWLPGLIPCPRPVPWGSGSDSSVRFAEWPMRWSISFFLICNRRLPRICFQFPCLYSRCLDWWFLRSGPEVAMAFKGGFKGPPWGKVEPWARLVCSQATRFSEISRKFELSLDWRRRLNRKEEQRGSSEVFS